MVFSNLIFLYLFLPVCLVFYFLCQNIRAKNAVLVLFSLLFYAWVEPVYLLPVSYTHLTLPTINVV